MILSQFDTKRTREHNVECATDGQRSYRVRSSDPLTANLHRIPVPQPRVSTTFPHLKAAP